MAKKSKKEVKKDENGVVKVSIFEGITQFFKMGFGYKSFRVDCNGNYMPNGKRIKLRGKGWSDIGEQNSNEEPENTENTTIYPSEIIVKGAFFEKVEDQYAKVMEGIRTIAMLKQARNQTFQETFNEINIFKKIIQENSEQLEIEGKLSQANSILESVEKAEEIIQRHYLTGLGDYACESERRVTAVEEIRREAAEFKKRKQEYSKINAEDNSYTTMATSPNGNSDPADSGENR